MFRKIFIALLCAAHLACAAPPPVAVSLNATILQVIETMPRDGGYSVASPATRVLSEAIRLAPSGLAIDAAHAAPSYCSGATYLVFAGVCQKLVRDGSLTLSDDALRALLVTGQRDGEGIWGRWNANGPGTARLFHELELGRNFTDWEQARAGDFMKIFWNNEIGAKERGHSVVYLGTETEDGVEYVRFWSSNKPRGYGEKRVARRSVMHAIFSRLENPENLARATRIPARDAFLASMLTARSSQAEVREKCGM